MKLTTAEKRLLSDAPVRMSKYCPDTHAAIMGPKYWKGMTFKRELSILDLNKGTFAGNCTPSRCLEIVISPNSQGALNKLLGVSHG